MNTACERQAADTVLLVRPVAFHGNPETAESNAFQRPPEAADPAAEQAAAAVEFAGLMEALSAAGVGTVVVPDKVSPATPDAVFPNNWVSFHADGTAVLYPMMAPSRRGERRQDILELLSSAHGFRIERVLDLSPHEQAGRFLEGTGSMVLDRVNRVAYACLSPRTDAEVLAEAARLLDYEPIAFLATDAEGIAVYHTNVMMCLGADFAVLCEQAIGDPGQRAAVRRRLEQTGHEIVPIDFTQMRSFAGNMLELRGHDGERVLALSARALECLAPAQVQALESRCRLLPVPVAAIEEGGGGSVRCMLAEVHLPRRD
ncbi:citrulline utilization hydrolase CtlX [Thioalkalivibrio sp. XN279]|uniref:citrulline utilization hydrolase CtlX n=1 Tax=Thioalkalivibrio sp. XN279 TaxID=2714953 RepID=UPI0014074D35|nr:arginine deiminase-related protein [Thioalkalivibrio sp. XN279]NHA14250.1 amidinotransferase [Thioalkalivibrio sp. XN279]